VLGFVHFFVMLLTLTIYSNLVQIKESYRKAAADLGASPAQVFWHVTLPLSLPGVAVGAFTTFVLAMATTSRRRSSAAARSCCCPRRSCCRSAAPPISRWLRRSA
jgi:ABC-type uncharacterized transport system permease subunit